MRPHGKSSLSAFELLQKLRQMKEGETIALFGPDDVRIFKLTEIKDGKTTIEKWADNHYKYIDEA